MTPKFNIAFISLLIVVIFLMLIPVSVRATPPTQQPDGQEYVVEAGGWLKKLAYACYGDALAFPLIVEATNTKAAEDTDFAVVTDPDSIRVGQKLWLPASCDIKAYKALVAEIEQAAKDRVNSFELTSQGLMVLPQRSAISLILKYCVLPATPSPPSLLKSSNYPS